MPAEDETRSGRAADAAPKRLPVAALRRRVAACCLGFALLTFAVPLARAFFRVEMNYNEGWNVWNAAMEANHLPLYSQKAGWTTVNYPMLSYVLVAQLHRWTHEYLFTARVLSLLALCISCLLVAAIVQRLTRARRPALLAGLFCLALFSVAADYPAYVGADDPQMLSHAFYLAGLWVCLKYGGRRRGLALSALLFVAAFSIKHNPIEFPLAALAYLLWTAPRRALWFGASCAILLAAAVGLQLHFGGRYFLDDLLAPRGYSLQKAIQQSAVELAPLLLPLGLSLSTGYRLRRDPALRMAAVLLALSLLLGVYFRGGEGVSINALFGSYFAMSILVGIFIARTEDAPDRRLAWAPLALFAWLLIPWLVVPSLDDRAARPVNWDPPRALEQFSAEQARFDAEVAFLRDQPGPALCESLLRCYYAGKPYVYDPFNATRMIGLGRLDAGVLVDALRRQQYGAVQLDGPLDGERRAELFASPIRAAIREYYQPVLENQDGVIYLPNSSPAVRAGGTTSAIASAGIAPGRIAPGL